MKKAGWETVRPFFASARPQEAVHDVVAVDVVPGDHVAVVDPDRVGALIPLVPGASHAERRDLSVGAIDEADADAVGAGAVAGDHAPAVDAECVGVGEPGSVDGRERPIGRPDIAVTTRAVLEVSGDRARLVDGRDLGLKRTRGIERRDGAVRRPHEAMIDIAVVGPASRDRASGVYRSRRGTSAR